LEGSAAARVDGLRLALGDQTLERIPPHLTLIPPVNVPAHRFDEAVSVLRRAAAAQRGPLALSFGAPRSFLPDNPVLYLPVGGDLGRLAALREALFVPPLFRSLSWPWVPHVTLLDNGDPERIRAAQVVLNRFAALSSFDRVTMLEESKTPARIGPDRRWWPLVDAAFGSPSVVGTGGLALEVSRGRVVGPGELALFQGDHVAQRSVCCGRAQLVLSGRREGRLAGAAVAWQEADGGHVAVAVAPDVRGQGVGRILLAQLEAALRSEGWRFPALIAAGPPGFYRATSSWAVPAGSASSRAGSAP
jgi:2'-5' RNA ligase/GNAT superfamily N-acetyltransferase